MLERNRLLKAGDKNKKTVHTFLSCGTIKLDKIQKLKAGVALENIITVTLELFKEKYVNELEAFDLPEEQLQFSALPKEILNTTDGEYGIVITNNGQAVGFFLLHATDRVNNYSNNPNALLLSALTIDHKHQGKGFAKKGMLALPHFMSENFPSYNEIVLAVNEKNLPAQGVYKKAGFHDTGERKAGPIGKQIL
nr:GNAT family N-acetyltransferase [Brevibacillus laterosporus]